MSTGGNDIVTALIEELDAAYETGYWHPLVVNLRSVPPAAWDWVPPGGTRTIRQIVRHLAACKLMYQNQGFGDRSLTWDEEGIWGPGQRRGPAEEELAWLGSCHARLRAAFAALTDDELPRQRLNHNGDMLPTRWFITTMTHHDLYHSGEINHIRSLYSGDDAWGQEGDR